MAKNIQVCAICGERLSGSYRMQLMVGPKGYRSYPVHQGPCKKKEKKAAGTRKAGA